MTQTFDPAAVPQLHGIFAPALDETDAGPLQVVEGALPDDLTGAYLRNGPNPRFTPIGSYTFPLDGDAMVHGVWFGGGEAHYRNRFVRTPAMAAEEAAGRALWGGLMSGVVPGADLVGSELAGTDKDLPDIHVVHHGGRLLALSEAARPFELTPGLETVGPYTFDGALPDGMCAHPKIDPDTGEMIVFRYSVYSAPWLTWAVVGPDGTVTRPETELEVGGSFMIHDCTITATHLVLFVCPVRFDLEAAMRGGPVLAWEPERGTRILAVDRSTGSVTRFETDAMWVWHFANAYDLDGPDGRRIVVDYSWRSNPGMGLVDEEATSATMRAVLELGSGRVRFEQLDDQLTEFPRIDDRAIGRQHRHFHVASKDPDAPPDVIGEWNRLLRYDTVAGTVQDLRVGDLRLGEAVFAPRGPDAPADDGYLISYAYDRAARSTDLLVLDASDIAGDPVARLRLPARVPFGLHGSWVPG